jgi:SWI/SNF-related matrix-associated actin-dependent regulator 1 of chromatin subfamily A
MRDKFASTSQKGSAIFAPASRVGLTPSPTCLTGQGGFPQRGCGQIGNETVAREPALLTMEGFSMSRSAVDLFTPDAVLPGYERLKGVNLFPHQADGVAFLLSKRRAILADDMGLGKTRQAIAAMEVGAPTGPILIVCPAALKLNWRREIRMIFPEALTEVVGFDSQAVKDARWIIVNYDLLKKHAEMLRAIGWAGVILDEAHFIKNNSKRTSDCLKLLGVRNDKLATLIGPSFVFLLTGTPMTNRPRDLFNLLRCAGHPASRSFLSFAKRYCDAYRNDFGWVTTGASNIPELNLLMKEVMLRRTKEEVLDLPPKLRSWIPVDVSSKPAVLNAVQSFLTWYEQTDPAAPNDRQFLAKLTKVRTQLHAARHQAFALGMRNIAESEIKAAFLSYHKAANSRPACAMSC